jgi:RNA:NAD 2'-phosphotransferase (TPT1/KptA family)
MVLRGIYENDSCQIFSQNNSNDQSFLLWHSGQQKKIRFDENSFFQIESLMNLTIVKKMTFGACQQRISSRTDKSSWIDWSDIVVDL